MIFLRFENISKYFGGLAAIDDVCFEVKEREIVGLIGPNGAGKTTIFNVITGVFKPNQGNLVLFEQNANSLSSPEICKLGVGRTFQIARPFGSMTVLENVMVGSFSDSRKKKHAREKAEKVIQLTGLTGKEFVRGKSLTVIERKRLELARALATDPKLLLLDEVLAGLNPTETDDAIRLLRRIRDEGITLLIIEHNMRAVMALTERIIVLDHGRKIAEGIPEEVANNPTVIEAYLGRGYKIGIS